MRFKVDQQRLDSKRINKDEIQSGSTKMRFKMDQQR